MGDYIGKERIGDVSNLLWTFEHAQKENKKFQSDYKMGEVTLRYLNTRICSEDRNDYVHAMFRDLGEDQRNIDSIKATFEKLYKIGVTHFVLITDKNEQYSKTAKCFSTGSCVKSITTNSGKLACRPDFTTNGLKVADVSDLKNYIVDYVDYAHKENNERVIFSNTFNIDPKDIPNDASSLARNSVFDFIGIASSLPECDLSVLLYNPNLIIEAATSNISGDCYFDTIRSNGVLKNGMDQILSPEDQEAYDITSGIFVSEADYVVIATVKKIGTESIIKEIRMVVDPKWLKEAMEFVSAKDPKDLRHLENILAHGVTPKERSIDKGYRRQFSHSLFREYFPF